MGDLLRMALARNLVAFRQAEGRSREEFAGMLGVECDLLGGLEGGEVDPELATVEAIAERIGMEPVLLLEEPAPPVDRTDA